MGDCGNPSNPGPIEGAHTDLWSQLEIDPEKETDRVASSIQQQVHGVLRRRGVVLGLSGGVDSSVVAALAVRALGPNRVLGLLMPERESSQDSLELGREIADRFGIETIVEDVTATLDAAGCYSRRDAAISRVLPGFNPGDRCKLVRPGLLDPADARLFAVVVEGSDGSSRRARLPPAEYRVVVASTCLKQRVRKMMEYHHADRLEYAVAGTANRLEYALGFFVKGGDGLADVKPIAHLYKSQVYELADHLGIPSKITSKPPTTDTYPLEASQEEFYFGLPHRLLDICLHARNHGIPVDVLAQNTGLTVEQIRSVHGDLRGKLRVAERLHRPPMVVDPIAEISFDLPRHSDSGIEAT